MYGHRLIRELLGLLFVFCGLLMLLSLWSFDAGDPTFNQAVTIEAVSVRNSAGLFGAFLSGFFVDLFGLPSYLWVIFFLAVGAAFVSRWLVLKWYRWIGYAMLFACALTASSAWGLAFHGIEGGGFTGDWLFSMSRLLLKSAGSFLFWLFVFLVATELSFSISWLALGAAVAAVASRLFRRGEAGEEEQKPRRKFQSLAAILSRRKADDGDDERPVLDIMLDKAGHASPAVIALPLHEEDAASAKEEEAPEAKPDEAPSAVVQAENTQSSPAEMPSFSDAEGLHIEVSDEEIARIFEQAELAAGNGPSSSPEAELVQDLPLSAVAVPSELSGLSLDPVPAQTGEPAPVELELSDIVSVQEQDNGQDDEKDEESHPEHDFPFPYDEEYASVDRVVAETMAREMQSMDEEEKGGQEAAPDPSFYLPKRKELAMPPMDLLAPLPENELQSRPDSAVLAAQGGALITCLKNFNVHATLARITPGPVVTMFEVRPAPGVKATRITNLANDLAMSLKAVAVRMQAPVPGTDTVGVEVPNEKRSTVHFREIVENDNFAQARSLLTVALGKDTGGRPVSADLAKMPHLLVAGATGAGKSVCLNAIILSLLYRARPDEVQMILVDPKQVELSMYADLPHLVHPVVTDMDITKNALLWAIDEMNRRLKVFSSVKVRNITGFNERQARLRAQVEEGGPVPMDENGQPEDLANMPFLVIIVDELADLMMVKRKEVEGSIVRLAQLARAAGIHLIIATQRPSVDVVTGLIKANFPCRIAFKVTSGQDSRTILDLTGAEKLLGMGDMLFKPNGGSIQRLHGAFVSDDEVSAVVEFWKKQMKPNYQVDFSEFGNEDEESMEDLGTPSGRGSDIVDDPIYSEAVQFVLESGKVSISQLQRRFRIGFNRAARYVEQMEKDGLLGQADGTRPRMVNR
ncbi:DNA translocase FtsK [Mailhella sp.]|uniref:DNA translocase FtsK n=1 Tax=Mailhella sp. TaxID=1981029 RepID=UPI00406432B6